MIDKLEKYGEWTYRMAWLMEITAAFIGLSVAAVMIINGFEADLSQSGFLSPIVNQIGPAGAFVMVALAELTKIPLATLLFAAPKLFKPLVILILFGMAFITYETVITGLERAQTIREAAYTEIIQQISIEEARIRSFNSESGTKTFENAQATTNELIESQKTQLAQLDQRADRQLKKLRLEGISDENKSKLASIDRSIPEIDNRIDTLEAEWKEWSSARQKIYDDYVAQIKGEFDKLVEAGDTERAIKYREEKLGPIATPKNRPDWKKRERELKEKTDDLRSRKQALFAEKEEILKSAQITDANQKKIQKFIEDHEKKREKILNRIDQLNDQMLAIGDRNIEFAQSEIDRVEDNIKAEQKLKALQTERIKQARLDQVRRLASKWFGIKPEDVSDDQAGTVALIWFGSLSLLAALAGPVTAITALSLQHIARVRRLRLEDPTNRHHFTLGEKFYRSMRHLIVHWRFERKKTVIKEVPVQQVVKEFVYIPLLADEPDEVHELLERELPEEVRAEIKGKIVDIKSDPSKTKANARKKSAKKVKAKAKLSSKAKTRLKAKSKKAKKQPTKKAKARKA